MPKNENDYKGKLLRLFREIMLLYNTPVGLSVKELAERVGSSWRTVYRDIEILSESGFLTEEVERGKFVIRGMDREMRKFEKNLQFTPVEAAMISQAVTGIPESNPMKKQIMEKLLSFSGMDEMLKTIVKTDISRKYELLTKAVREKKQVVLVNYHSSNSQSIRSRIVEPYSFSVDGVFVKAFEAETTSNKTFKIERIEEVQLKSDAWKFEKKHEPDQLADIFGFTGEEETIVSFKMTMRATNLLKEEFPATMPFIYKESARQYVFEGPVRNFTGVGRFIMGLWDEVEGIKPDRFKEFLLKKIKINNLS